MRCDEVILELAVPSADHDPAVMAEHLAGCEACAEWARRAERLDRLWDATRPTEPTPAAWNVVWSNIAEGLAARETHPASTTPATPIVIPARRPAPGRWIAAVALVGLAQAAAILVALGLAWRAPSDSPESRLAESDRSIRTEPTAIRSAHPVDPVVDIEAGGLMVIRFDRKSSRLEDRTPAEMNVGADIGMEMTNAMESIATPQMAAR